MTWGWFNYQNYFYYSGTNPLSKSKFGKHTTGKFHTFTVLGWYNFFKILNNCANTRKYIYLQHQHDLFFFLFLPIMLLYGHFPSIYCCLWPYLKMYLFNEHYGRSILPNYRTIAAIFTEARSELKLVQHIHYPSLHTVILSLSLGLPVIQHSYSSLLPPKALWGFPKLLCGSATHSMIWEYAKHLHNNFKLLTSLCGLNRATDIAMPYVRPYIIKKTDMLHGCVDMCERVSMLRVWLHNCQETDLFIV